MIRELKPQLSKVFLFVVSLAFSLIGFFIYAAAIQPRFFSFLAIAIAINILVLIFFQRRLKRKRAELKLEREEYSEKANLMRTGLVQEEEAIDAFRRKIVAYSQLKGLSEKLSMSLSIEDTVHTLCREVADLFSENNTTILVYLFEDHTGELAIVHSSRHHHAINIKQKRGDIFDRWIIKTLQPLVLEDANSDFRFDMEKVRSEDDRPIGSLLSVPLLVHNKPIGILRLDSPSAQAFHADDLRFLKTIGDLAAVALENAELFDKAEDLAIRDSLTGLYLRRYLMERLGEEISRHLRRDKGLAFIMFDLDHFKRYNDQFGHTAGDIVLKQFTGLLQSHFGTAGNLLCRYGGEEFAVLVPECDKEEATALAREFVALVAKQDIVLRREKTHVTVSAGVAAFPEDAKAREDLIQKADEALYQAKHKGRNRVCVA